MNMLLPISSLATYLSHLRPCRILLHAALIAAAAAGSASAQTFADLADTTTVTNGDAMVGVKQAGTGAVGRTLHSKMAESLTPEDYGAVGDGVANDTTALQNALNAAAPNGLVTLRRNGRYRILSNLTFPMGVSLKGQGFSCGANGVYDATFFNARGSVLLLSSSAKIIMSSASSLSDLYIFRDGMTFPASNSSAYAGTAIEVDGSAGVAKVDTILQNLLIIGFNKAVYGNTCPRLIADNVNFDCINGIEINYAGDPVRLTRCHGWPFGTISYTPFSEAINRRSGVAYSFSTNADAGKISDSHSFGYATGYLVNGANGVHMINCSANNYPSGTASVGFSIQGTSDHVGLFSCQARNHVTGVIVNMSTDLLVANVENCLLGDNTQQNIQLLKGGANVVGNKFFNAQQAVTVHDANASLHMSGNYVQSTTNEIVANFLNSPYVQINADNYFQDTTSPVWNGGGGIPTVASAGTVSLPRSGGVIQVTGTTGVTALSGGWPGRRVTLSFNNTCTLTDSTGLQMAGNFTGNATSTITFIFTSATQCYEVSRSLN